MTTEEKAVNNETFIHQEEHSNAGILKGQGATEVHGFDRTSVKFTIKTCSVGMVLFFIALISIFCIVFMQYSTPLVLSEDFPTDKRELFFSFVSFSKRINAEASQKWLERSAPVRYEDFLSAVALSLPYLSERKFERIYIQNCQKLLDDFLIPLSIDINQLNYRGYKPNLDERFFNSLRRYIASLTRRLDEKSRKLLPAVGDWVIPIRESFIAKHYADTFLYVADGKYLEPYFFHRVLASRFLGNFIIEEDEYFDWLGFYLELLEPRANDTKISIINNEINKINNHISNYMMRVLAKATSLYADGNENAIISVLVELEKSRQSIKEVVGHEILSSSLNKIRSIDKAIKEQTLDTWAGITVLHGLDVRLFRGEELRASIDNNSVKDGATYLIMDTFLPVNAYVRFLSVIVENLSVSNQLDKLRAIREHMRRLTKAIEFLPPSYMNLSMRDHLDNMIIPYVCVNYGDWESTNIKEVTE